MTTENKPENETPLLDLDDDTPRLCPYQRAGLEDGEACEACQ